MVLGEIVRQQPVVFKKRGDPTLRFSLEYEQDRRHHFSSLNFSRFND